MDANVDNCAQKNSQPELKRTFYDINRQGSMLTKQSLQRIVKRILLREEKENHCQKTIEKQSMMI